MKRPPLYTLLRLLLILSPLHLGSAAAPPPPTDTPEARTMSIENAIQQEITNQQDSSLIYLLFETQIGQVSISENGDWAFAQLIPLDAKTGAVVPAEPGLALAQNIEGSWHIFLPNDPQWSGTLNAIPDSLISIEDKEAWLNLYEQSLQITDATIYGGYKLPWEGGKKLVLTQSISHYTPPNPTGSMHYSFDFATWHDASGQSQMFAVHAAKGGQVKYARWTQSNGDESSPGNYLVIEDKTTSPTTFALYLHLAKDSIPSELRQSGALVLQGQFIGLADDTGFSTGNHLHFQVHTNPYSYWGNSVDITFSDVTINGGRPRTPIEVTNWPQYGSQGQREYTSGNYYLGDSNPPTGNLLEPADNLILESSTLNVSGFAQDDTGIASIQIKANYAGAWHNIGSVFNSSPFSYSWNLCSSQVPDGPISLALDIRDTSGNYASGLPGLRHLIKEYKCPLLPPACIPNNNQVALYTDIDYRGTCVILGAGSHNTSALGTVGDNNAASIKVGSQVWATLFKDKNFDSRGETFFKADSSLSDNRIGIDKLSSLIVQPIATLPSTPRLLYPDNNSSFPANASLSLSWEDTAGSSEFQIILDGVERAWQAQPVFHLGSMASGVHTWQVRSRNNNGTSGWSLAYTFTIQAASNSSESLLLSVPFFDTMENGYNGWIRGEWDQNLIDNHTPGGRISWHYEINDQLNDYDTGTPNSGYLTSPAFAIPTAGYAMQFWYLYETEEPGSHWDQRWIQISVDGNPYQNVLQLFDDPPNFWQQSPPIDLSDFAGHTIRFRFHFETLDASSNQHKGWFIDDFSIDLYPPPACIDPFEPDESPPGALSLAYGQSINRQICPQGDNDYFQFSGKAGDRVGLSAIAGGLYTPDTYLFLLDSDFSSVLVENDDRYPGVETDSYLTYYLTRDGTYYIKVRPWNHPSAGGSEYNYTITLFGNDTSSPGVQIKAPNGGAGIPVGHVPIVVSASDLPSAGETASGISHVDFYWHSEDWANSDWVKLGSDWNGFDGWSYNFDTSNLPEQTGAAIFVRVFDWAGNGRGAAVWNLRLGEISYDQYLPLISR